MSLAVDIHPEELLDRAARGQLTSDEQTRLETHLAHCVACRAQLAAADDFALEDDLASDDAAEGARLAAAAMARLGLEAGAVDVPATAPREERAERSRRTDAQVRALAVAAAVLVMLISGGAATAYWMVWGREPVPSEQRPPAMAPARAPQPEVVADIASPELDEPIEIATDDTATDDIATDDIATDDIAPDAERTARASRRVPTEPALGPDELLARANAARRSGDDATAVSLYRALQTSFASSREARVSRIAYGRLLLDRRGDVAGALAQFDAYLEGRGDATLAEEARVGRALALRRLGRSAQERLAWQDLIAQHPSSAQVARARERLRQLDAAP